MEPKDIYSTLDEARAELARRWQNIELRAAIEAELGGRFLLECRDQPRAFLFWQLLSPSNGFAYFMQAAHYVGAKPFAGEFWGDRFTRSNREKQGLGRLRATEGKRKILIDLISFRSNYKKKISDVVTRTGQKMVEFHHNLLDLVGYTLDQRDITDWCRAIGGPSDYYYPYLLHFVTHGVLFENFQTDADEGENRFTQAVVLPAIKKVEERFGLKPLVLRLYPEDQTEDEDFYWWCYPPRVNDYIVNYAREHSLPVRYLD